MSMRDSGHPPAAILQIKICGITRLEELHMLDQAGVDYAGLWFHVPRGKYSLDRERFSTLVQTPLRRLRCIGVTIEKDPRVITEFVHGSGVVGVQLQGFQLPNEVLTIKRCLDDRIEVFKVLHVQRGTCLEQRFLRQYAKCGADAFILDSFISRHQPGSTGEPIPPTTVLDLMDRLGPERLFLAGGVDDNAIRAFHFGSALRGVDMDTGVRVDGKIDRGRVLAVVSAARSTNND